MFKYDLNSFELILKAANILYPGFEARISFLSEADFYEILEKRVKKPVYGVTIFETGMPPLIILNATLPGEHSVEIIAHEMAHVVAGIRAG